MMDATHRPGLGAVSAQTPLHPVGRLRVVAGLTLALLVAELVYIALASPRFALRRVEIRGDERVAREVGRRLRLAPGTNMLRAPLGLVKRQAESVPAVRKASVSRAFPNRVVVTIERREPLGVIRRADRAVLVDPQGTAFTVPGESGWGLPELVAPHLLSGDLGREEAASEIEALLAVLRALGPDPRLRVARLQLSRDGAIELAVESGAVVNMGEPKELGAKVRLLAAAIEQIGADRIKRLDLSDPAAAWWEPNEKGNSARQGGQT